MWKDNTNVRRCCRYLKQNHASMLCALHSVELNLNLSRRSYLSLYPFLLMFYFLILSFKNLMFKPHYNNWIQTISIEIYLGSVKPPFCLPSNCFMMSCFNTPLVFSFQLEISLYTFSGNVLLILQYLPTTLVAKDFG